MKKFEYLISDCYPNEGAFAGLGEEGWELVAVIDTSSFYRHYFKREIFQPDFLDDQRIFCMKCNRWLGCSASQHEKHDE